MQVVTGLVGKRAVHRLKHDLADEGRDIGRAHDTQGAAFLFPRTGAAGLIDIEVNSVFVLDDLEYTKIGEERLSCCKVLNAIRNDTKEKVMILPLQRVKVSA